MTDAPARHPLLTEYWDLPLEEHLQERGESACLPAFSIGLCAIRYEQFVALLRRFPAERLAPDGDLAWYGWMNAIALLGLRDMQPAVMAAAEHGALSGELWEPEYFESDLAAAEHAPEDIERFKKAKRCCLKA
jgi:hypothetical protein